MVVALEYGMRRSWDGLGAPSGLNGAEEEWTTRTRVSPGKVRNQRVVEAASAERRTWR
jgi:hypothetical protein